MWNTSLKGLEELLISIRDLTINVHQALLLDVAQKAEQAARATSHQATLKMHVHERDPK